MDKFNEQITELIKCINSLFYDREKNTKQPYQFHTKRMRSDCDSVMTDSLISIIKMAYQLIDLKNRYNKESKEGDLLYKNNLIENYRNEIKILFYSFRVQEIDNIKNIMEYLKNQNPPEKKAPENIIFKEALKTLESLARKKSALEKINNGNSEIINWDIQVFNRFMQEVQKRKVGIIKPLSQKIEILKSPKSEITVSKAELLYRENKLAVGDIAKELNITKKTLYSYLHYKNVPIHRASKVHTKWLSKSKATAAAKAEILYRENKLTVPEIAKKLGIAEQTLYQYLHRRNVPINRSKRVSTKWISKRKTTDAKAEILYRENKLTVPEIAEKLNISEKTLYRYLHYKNVPIHRASKLHQKWIFKSKTIVAKAEILYRENKLTVPEIAEKLNIAETTLYRYLHYKNVPTHRASKIRQKAAKAEVLYRENKLTVTEIAKKLGIGQGTLYRYLWHRNVPLNRKYGVHK